MRISGTTSADAIVRTGPTYINRTSGMTGVQGIGVQVQFTGSSGSDAGSGQLLQQAVFFHSQRCYTAGTEFGFRKLVGTVSDYQNNSQTDLIEFYYALNSNCYGACQAQEQGGGGAWTTLSLYANGINTIPIKNWSTGSVCSTSSSGGCNSHGGTDWLYEAWLAPTGSSPYTYWWWVVARDPYCDTTVRGHAVCYDIVNDNGSSVPHQVESWFRGSNGSGLAPSPNTDFAYDIAHGGLAGYMTFTTSLSARFSNESTHASGGTSPITMNIVSAFAPYY